MASLKEIRNRIRSVISTQQITKAMKMVAAAKLRRAQDRILRMRPYAQSLKGILQNLSANLDASQIQSPYLEERPVERVLLIVVTSDRGLCGAFNNNLAKAAQQAIHQQYEAQYQAGKLDLLCIGKKGYEYFERRGYSVVHPEHTDLFTRLDFDHVLTVGEQLLSWYEQGVYDRIDIFYNEFKNVATQIPRQEQLLPASADMAEDTSSAEASMEYILEPSAEAIVTDLIPKIIKIQFYKALLESNAAEHGARMMAMDKATENAGELLRELRLTYNRTRQAVITKEIIEIVSGASALEEA
ncbi:ATP synthase F1 subunit gamma [Thermonema rossianum]|uniref:ATP synthase F1 subunit gamma n=1 Tax=Thermonema rossianum TaxID=55505 RepID=UPI000570A224|nr:ATP synthase F1 subunit gamma [Thermonema rossianum]